MTLKIISILVSLIWLPLSFYSSWLILNKIDASELMYFLYWLNLPVAIISTLISWLIRDEK
jgi:hypothetical protein